MSPSKIQLSEASTPPFTTPYSTAFDLIQDAITNHSTRTALVCMHQPSSFLQSITRSPSAPYLRWTFAELSRAGHAFAQALDLAGVRPGMSIVTFLTNGAEIWVTFLASLELNCALAPMDLKVTSNSEDIKHMFNLTNPSVIIAQDVSVAAKLAVHVPAAMTNALVRLLAADKNFTDATHPGWQNFDSFVDHVDRNGHVTLPDVVRSEEDIILVVFTSGTTSVPKGCPQTNKLFTMTLAWASVCGFDPTRSVCIAMPTYHMFGFVYVYKFLISGLKVVHPAAGFDPGTMLRAIHSERCSDVGAVPAIIDALLAHPELENTDTSCLKSVMLGATAILPEMLLTCIEKLGSLKASEGFGMSEVGPAMIARYDDLPCGALGKAGIGPPLPGNTIRICDHTTRELVPIGEPGELHIGSSCVIEKYWLSPSQGDSPNEVFYKEGDVNFMATGDMAVMDEDGLVRIVGRYKDMIIRGGVNISPGSIESFLSKRFGLFAEVIGVPDEHAGEVPVAIVKEWDGEIELNAIKEILIRELGKSFVLEEIIHLETIGLQDYPRTASGKVKKNELRKIVANLRQPEMTNGDSPASDNILDVLSRVWTRVLGLGPGVLTPQTSVNDWADSLVLARFVAVLHRETGLTIAMHELLENHTLEAQAKLLSFRQLKLKSTPPEIEILPRREGPPGIEDIFHTHGDVEKFQRVKRVCQKTLAPFGLGWMDVEEVIPLTDVTEMFLKRRRPNSGNHRHSFLCPNTSIETASTALRRALQAHHILRTVAIKLDTETPLHVAIRSSEQWFSHCIKFIDSVATADDLNNLNFDGEVLDFISFPGPMFRALITHVQDENCAGIIYMVQHSVLDATSLPMFLEDLDNLLINPKAAIHSYVPFKAWVDSYHDLAGSSSARQAVNWHKKRLDGISSLAAALFPPQRSPEWFTGSSKGWIDSNGKLGPDRESLDSTPTGLEGISMQCSLTDLVALKRDHSIEAPQLVKAALAFVNTRHTKQPVALFNQTQAGRVWPFLPDWQNVRLPSAMDVNGPTLARVLNKITINNNETVLAMLQTLQVEQALLTKYSAAPIKEIVAALNEEGAKDGDTWNEAMRRQEFNWIPTSANTLEYQKLKGLRVTSWDDLGILWNCRMVDQTTLEVKATWDDAQLRRVEMEGLLGELMGAAAAISRKENWEKILADVI